MRIGRTLHLSTNTKVDSLSDSMRKNLVILLYLRDEDQGERGTVRKHRLFMGLRSAHLASQGRGGVGERGRRISSGVTYVFQSLAGRFSPSTPP